MVESDLNTGKTAQIAHGERLGFHRDPSFSVWGNKDGIQLQNGVLEAEIVNTSESDDNFELPVLQEVGKQTENLENEIKTKGTPSPSPRRGNNNENYTSFDIEDAYKREIDSKDTNFGYKHKDVHSSSKNHTAVSDILKTLFFVLMWYIFSTLLTVYNKTLLGDDMGKFPAPSLMNTIHFAMQAVLSRGITYFWSHRFEPRVPMSQKDYFMKDGICL